MTSEVMNLLMNIGVADDQAKRRFSLYENGCDLGGETLTIEYSGERAARGMGRRHAQRYVQDDEAPLGVSKW